jgi:hypothetical protein
VSAQLAEKVLLRRVADLDRAADATKMNHRAVLGHDGVEWRELFAGTLYFFQHAPGDQ